jgi:hypothetical protein
LLENWVLQNILKKNILGDIFSENFQKMEERVLDTKAEKQQS